MQKIQLKLNALQWFIVLWIVGFLSLLMIAGCFKLILYFAYSY